MEPEINVGDVVFVKEAETINVGDVISFKKGGSVITHRVIEITNENGEEKYKTKGDYNNSEDVGLIGKKDIEGSVAFKVNKIGQILIFLKTKMGIISIIIAVIIIFMNNKTIKNKKLERKRKRELYELKLVKKEMEGENA